METKMKEILKETLIGEEHFKRVADLTKSDIPSERGLYAIRVNQINALPKIFADELRKRNSQLIYVGKADTQTLQKRLWGQELHANGHGTFFRSIGAALGYLPPKGSLKNDTHNYTFSSADEQEIIRWITANLSISFVVFDSKLNKLSLKDIEEELIEGYAPLLNLAHSPNPFKPLKQLRKECNDRAHDLSL